MRYRNFPSKFFSGFPSRLIVNLFFYSTSQAEFKSMTGLAFCEKNLEPMGLVDAPENQFFAFSSLRRIPERFRNDSGGSSDPAEHDF